MNDEDHHQYNNSNTINVHSSIITPKLPQKFHVHPFDLSDIKHNNLLLLKMFYTSHEIISKGG